MCSVSYPVLHGYVLLKDWLLGRMIPIVHLQNQQQDSVQIELHDAVHRVISHVAISDHSIHLAQRSTLLEGQCLHTGDKRRMEGLIKGTMQLHVPMINILILLMLLVQDTLEGRGAQEDLANRVQVHADVKVL